MLQYKRVYEPVASADGLRVLVDRLWPRGLSKQALQLDAWLPDVAPSTELRREYQHQASAFAAFAKKYREELAAHPEHWQGLLGMAEQGTLTLLFAARDPQLSNARVLAEFLEDELDRRDQPNSPTCYAERD
ncbi:MAG: DUF488 family protein [Pseudomonas sp.]|nr:DUF488 family protein [Pseudomonas sp.]